ncbi:hypothetical protein MUK42_32839 [Musa troglodytarum]|uniref:Uncharacterized protein n=1 Tax=Musa troglodytarum TaxID=320322 RepID=A0A9E7GK19_9LILI|nr:hypothetical protein MUK42_32839 [Musa troglodytarum]
MCRVSGSSVISTANSTRMAIVIVEVGIVESCEWGLFSWLDDHCAASCQGRGDLEEEHDRRKVPWDYVTYYSDGLPQCIPLKLSLHLQCLTMDLVSCPCIVSDHVRSSRHIKNLIKERQPTKPDMRGHLPWSKASLAVFTAKSTSSLSPAAMLAITSPRTDVIIQRNPKEKEREDSATRKTSASLPETASTKQPLMKSLVNLISGIWTPSPVLLLASLAIADRKGIAPNASGFTF